jgi:hypothetical protein
LYETIWVPARGHAHLRALSIVKQPSDRRVVDGHDPGHPAGARRVEHGACDAAAEGRDSPLRPGLPIHLHRVRPSLLRSGRAPLNGLGRRRLRQCHVRELLRHAGMRASRPAPVQDAGRGRGPPCSNSSRASTTRAGVIRRSGISPRSTTSVVMRPIPTHTSLPPCSRPSRTKALRAAPKWGRP